MSRQRALPSRTLALSRYCRGRSSLLASAAHQHGSILLHRARDFPLAAEIRSRIGSNRVARYLQQPITDWDAWELEHVEHFRSLYGETP